MVFKRRNFTVRAEYDGGSLADRHTTSIAEINPETLTKPTRSTGPELSGSAQKYRRGNKS